MFKFPKNRLFRFVQTINTSSQRPVLAACFWPPSLCVSGSGRIFGFCRVYRAANRSSNLISSAALRSHQPPVRPSSAAPSPGSRQEMSRGQSWWWGRERGEEDEEGDICLEIKMDHKLYSDIMEDKAAVAPEILINQQDKEVKLTHLFLRVFQLIPQINMYLYCYFVVQYFVFFVIQWSNYYYYILRCRGRINVLIACVFLLSFRNIHIKIMMMVVVVLEYNFPQISTNYSGVSCFREACRLIEFLFLLGKTLK